MSITSALNAAAKTTCNNGCDSTQIHCGLCFQCSEDASGQTIHLDASLKFFDPHHTGMSCAIRSMLAGEERASDVSPIMSLTSVATWLECHF